MADHADHADHTPAALRVRDVVARTGLSRSQVYALIDDDVIPRLRNCGMTTIRVPRWSVDAWVATGDWRHPDWRPVPPGADVDTTADVIPLHPDAS